MSRQVQLSLKQLHTHGNTATSVDVRYYTSTA
jgi:hypothetical protein